MKNNYLTGTDNIETKNSVSAWLYPNPVSNVLNMQISLEASEIVKVEVIDVIGKTMSTNNFAMNRGINNQTQL